MRIVHDKVEIRVEYGKGEESFIRRYVYSNVTLMEAYELLERESRAIRKAGFSIRAETVKVQ